MMDLYKGLYVVTNEKNLQKVTPAEKMKTVDESKLFKVVKPGKEGKINQNPLPTHVVAMHL